ncbi:MAG: ornithine cyclodeaminase family protein, partial [Pseudomonadota bacterium]|nr:ornithine cyclodeaminase family protein [Pseudomonadota bacterium]
AFPPLIDSLRTMFRAGCTAPVRHHHSLAAPLGGGAAGDLLLMPAWQAGQHIGIKIVTVFPDNSTRGLSAVMASYVLLDGETGKPLAFIDGEMLTVRRTAAASALAADYLARDDAHRLTMLGTGALAPHLIEAHASVRPIDHVRIWGRTPEKAVALADRFKDRFTTVEAITDKSAAIAAAHIVSCATLSADPLVHGADLGPGTHVDLVGAFRPDLRESDDQVIARGRVFVDTRAGALAEAGDLIQAFAAGVAGPEDIQGDLFDLCGGDTPGRQGAAEITVFKSVGTALEDLAAAILTLGEARAP